MRDRWLWFREDLISFGYALLGGLIVGAVILSIIWLAVFLVFGIAVRFV